MRITKANVEDLVGTLEELGDLLTEWMDHAQPWIEEDTDRETKQECRAYLDDNSDELESLLVTALATLAPERLVKGTTPAKAPDA